MHGGMRDLNRTIDVLLRATRDARPGLAAIRVDRFKPFAKDRVDVITPDEKSIRFQSILPVSESSWCEA